MSGGIRTTSGIRSRTVLLPNTLRSMILHSTHQFAEKSSSTGLPVTRALAIAASNVASEVTVWTSIPAAASSLVVHESRMGSERSRSFPGIEPNRSSAPQASAIAPEISGPTRQLHQNFFEKADVAPRYRPRPIRHAPHSSNVNHSGVTRENIQTAMAMKTNPKTCVMRKSHGPDFGSRPAPNVPKARSGTPTPSPSADSAAAP